VKGEVRAWPPRRILDVLNNVQTPYLSVDQASVLPLSRWGKAQSTGAENIVLNKDELSLVWLVRETTVEPPKFATVHKVPQTVVAYVGPFVAQGSIHIVREATLGQALDTMKEQFIALTEPSVICLSAAGLTFRGGIVVAMNKARIMAIQVSG
jgi:hypothetical protein